MAKSQYSRSYDNIVRYYAPLSVTPPSYFVAISTLRTRAGTVVDSNVYWVAADVFGQASRQQSTAVAPCVRLALVEGILFKQLARRRWSR